MNFEFSDVEVFFLKRALKWRIGNIDWFIEKKGLEGLRKANQLSEKATLLTILEKLEERKNTTAAVEDGEVMGPVETERVVGVDLSQVEE